MTAPAQGVFRPLSLRQPLALPSFLQYLALDFIDAARDGELAVKPKLTIKSLDFFRALRNAAYKDL